jgi:hydrogenase maturation protease
MTEPAANATTLVICLGNEDRGDDGFGPCVARRLGATPAPGARVIEHNGDALAMIDLWNGCERVIVVDAIAADCEPGTVLRFDLSRERSPFELEGTSTHALGAGGAVELARALGMLPRRVDVVAVAAGNFALGTQPAEEVAAQVDEVARTVRAMIAPD